MCTWYISESFSQYYRYDMGCLVHGNNVPCRRNTPLSHFPDKLCAESLQSLIKVVDIACVHPDDKFICIVKARKGMVKSENGEKQQWLMMHFEFHLMVKYLPVLLIAAYWFMELCVKHAHIISLICTVGGHATKLRYQSSVTMNTHQEVKKFTRVYQLIYRK